MPFLPTALLLATLLTPAPTRFSWPLPPPHPVVRAFETPATPFGPGHRGVDLSAAAGTAVLAAGDGVVVYAGAVASRTLVSIHHRGGLRTTYEPVSPTVAAGHPVRRGDVIGHLQEGHCASPCLHWGARRGDEYLDPLRLVTPGRIRLLPVAGPPRGS
ncbi:peptidoglycan DD-metalloendopeptidase family protein [Lentzea nigeriaca]|uniref:peptidoglycan DD-metalloendopeptidase family protein n=1 Tax=Lentzea nigeriaca TaxID=1128665 RepID=UPI00195D5A28|nr:peptidoglycan DD-metalloendopeptidase family protein [Lentzea nigeriaca]MBM7860128.1 murein DD-endopeptidase MepM/ murein hydrolase activator NlpD [Lentzea nigeriaca]